MDYLEQRFRRKEVLHSLIEEIRVANTSLDQRKEVGHLEERQSRVLLPRRHYGLPVAEGQRSDGVTHYIHDGAPPGHQIPARRQQSLPSRRTESDDKQRHVNSAPSRKNRSQSQKPPLPTVNNLVAKSRGPGGETSHILTTNFAGFSTKDQEASPTRCSRFASTWAQVRAENHIDMCATTSPDGLNRKTGQEEGKSDDRQPADRTAASRSPNREDSKGNRYQGMLDPASHVPSPDREQTKPEKYRGRQDPAQAKAKKGEKSKKQTTRSKHLEDETVLQMSDVPKENLEVQGAKHDTKRPEWNNSLAIMVPQTSPTPVTSWRRYEAELTHVPTVTSTQQVYKAYTGSYKQQLQLRNEGDDNDYDLTENTPSAKGLQHKGRSREDKRPDSGTPREHVLTRNEAQMFLHLQNVYGSEAYRQQRKELFFKKLTDVQLTELQQQEADRRRKQQRIQESRRRQKRQLMYVRRKFRKEQVHRFRTQYVTSRVLEYERADRNMYGLPRDWNQDDSVDLDSDDDNDEEDLHGEDVKRKDSFRYDEGSGKKKARNVNGKSTEGHQAKSTKFGKASQKSITPDKSKVVLESKASADNDPLNSEPSSKDKTNAADPKSGSSKTCVHVPLTQPNAQKSANSRVITETSKQNPKKKEDGDSETLKLTENGVVTPKNLSKNTKGGQEQSKMAKNIITAARKPTESNTLKAADVPTGGVEKPTKDASSSRTKNTGASTGAFSAHKSARTENDANVAQLTASLSKPTMSVREDNKPERETTEKKSESVGNNNRNNHSRKQDKNDSAQQNKNIERKPVETVNSTNNKDDCTTKDINKEKQHNKGRDRRIDGNNQAAVSGKGRHATTTKKSDVKVPSGESTSDKAFSKDNTLNGPDVGSFHREPSSNLAAVTSSSTNKDDGNKSSASRRRDVQKRKPAQPHFKSEVEQKNHLERQYGKLFEMNAGPTWNPGARPPKMEGIDTVLIRVKDKKGRTKLKKKEVKDVVKDAKAQLTQPDRESLRQAGGKGDKSDQHIQQGIRPASADTLDFDEDENDDEEDVFERVRRKYNLQIDSDGDESIV